VSRFPPWQDHELAILYEYVNIRLTADVVAQIAKVLHGRSPSAIQNRMEKLRDEAGIVLGGLRVHRPGMAEQSIALASQRLAEAIERELSTGLPQHAPPKSGEARLTQGLSGDD
jgi:hypothetical protein